FNEYLQFPVEHQLGKQSRVSLTEQHLSRSMSFDFAALEQHFGSVDGKSFKQRKTRHFGGVLLKHNRRPTIQNKPRIAGIAASLASKPQGFKRNYQSGEQAGRYWTPDLSGSAPNGPVTAR